MSPVVSRAILAAVPLLVAGTVATAATVTVNVGTDPIDIDWQTATIADLPGPDGVVSFSEAMIVTNNTPGHDTIEFAVPQSDWQMQWLLPGRAVIQSSYTFFWRANDEVTVDGRTQTLFTGDTNPDGAEVALFGGEPFFNVDNCEVYGLDYGAFTLNGSNSVAEGNTGGINITVFGGSGSLIKDNVGGTLKLDRSSNNVVVGNTFLRVRNLGWVGGGQANVNNRIGGPNPEDRNYITGLGTYNSEGYPGGFSIQQFDAVDTIIENNSIGSTPDGMESGTPAASVGIRFEGENHNTVIRNNRIAGVLGIGIGPHHAGQLFGWALLIGGSGSGIEITGNTIGLNAEGSLSSAGVIGIDVGASTNSTISDITIGGLGAGEAIRSPDTGSTASRSLRTFRRLGSLGTRSTPTARSGSTFSRAPVSTVSPRTIRVTATRAATASRTSPRSRQRRPSAEASRSRARSTASRPATTRSTSSRRRSVTATGTAKGGSTSARRSSRRTGPVMPTSPSFFRRWSGTVGSSPRPRRWNRSERLRSSRSA
ncbi:MAG: hypothetical protein R3E97_03665 [Candidatus Eisenbacteria bacterium]